MNAQFRQTASLLLRKTIAGLSLSVILLAFNNAQANTIASFTGGIGFNQQGYFGQSFTTVAGGPASNITFNFFSDIPATTPFASGTGFILTMQYLSGFGDSNNFAVNGTPAPETGESVILLGLALSAFAIIRRVALQVQT